MRLYILGKNSDDKGTQLEQLTVRILESQRLQNIQTNIQGSGGNEVDVTAHLLQPIGVKTEEVKVIAECKAYNDPINVSDWLKFIGKLCYANKKTSHTIGIMICLSGANGAVVGMYNENHISDQTVQLIANGDLINLISTCFEVEQEIKVRERIVAMSYDNIYEMNLLYYDKKIYWAISFMDKKYTITDASGLPLTKEEVLDIIPFIANYTPYIPCDFIDIKEHLAVQQQLTTINMMLLTILANATSGTLTDIAQKIKTNAAIIDTTILEMAISKNPFVEYNKEENTIALKDEDSIDMVDFYRYILHSGCTLDMITSKFYQEHINQDLLAKIQNIQYGIEIPPARKDDCIFFLKHSPTALFSAITPNGFFHAYEAMKEYEHMKNMYVSYFIKMLTDSFVEDFQNKIPSDMYHNFFKITEMKISSNIQLEVDGKMRNFESYTNFGIMRLQECDKSVVCVIT